MKRSHGRSALVLAALSTLLAVTPLSPTHADAPAQAGKAQHPPGKPTSTKKATRKLFYAGHAGGSLVQAVGVNVRSDLVGSSTVGGYALPGRDSNEASGVNALGGLVKLGAINTSSQARRIPHGTALTSTSRTAGINLLGGVIKADAVETVTHASKVIGGKLSADANTRFLGLTIAGQRIPVNVAPNSTINVPGVATVILNATYAWTSAGGQYIQAYGLYAQLLKPSGRLPAGAIVILNPTVGVVTPGPPPAARAIQGQGYGSYVNAHVGPALNLEAGRSGAVATPPGGTGGKVIQNTTSDVNVPGVLSVGAVKSTTYGRTVKNHARVKMTNAIGGIDLFDGLITADAIRVSADSTRSGKKHIKNKLSTELVDLVVAGRHFPVNTSPNTTVFVADLGKVVINRQVRSANGAYAMGLQIQLTTEKVGLPVGAVIEVSVASTYIG